MKHLMMFSMDYHRSMLACQHVAWTISALQQQSSKYMFKFQGCVCFHLGEKLPHKFQYKYISHPLTSAWCLYSGQGLPSGAVRARSGWCSDAGKWRPVGCPLQPGGSGSGHLFLGKLRSGWPAQARSPHGVVAALELPFHLGSLLRCCLAAFMQISQRLDNWFLWSP